MSVRPGSPMGARARRRTAMMAGLLALTTLGAACSSSSGTSTADGAAPSASSSPTPVKPDVTVDGNLPAAGSTLQVDKTVTLTAHQGTFDSVAVATARGDQPLKGSLSDDKTTWTASDRLEPGTRYRVKTVAEDAHGRKLTQTKTFRTQPLSLDQQTFPSFVPLNGQTVGVGMPVMIKFDVPVTDKAAIEKHLHVSSTSGQKGAWHWISDYEVHWRPETYWKPGTDVTVNADINSIPAGNGIYGQLSRTETFHVGDALVSRVNVQTHEMKVYRNGALLRTIPISAGKPGFITRSGVKVIIEKFRHKRMDASTVGIKKNSPEYYNISNVEYAMRVTYSGEFIHAAPWSVGTQGSENTSHGCVGMSNENAKWLFDLSKVGDVVEVTGSDRHMTLTNGYGDWNESFSQYAAGSALS